MTWLFNPAEPTGQPTQAGVDYYSKMLTDITGSTRGRCGYCAACPPMWRMTVPSDLTAGGDEDPYDYGVPWGEMYGGNYYFRRAKYNMVAQDFAGGSRCWWSNAFLIDLDPVVFPDQQTVHPADVSNHQWRLGFYATDSHEYGLQWFLLTPILDEFGVLPKISRYEFAGPPKEFSCLGPNKFNYLGPIASSGDTGLPFPYRPASLTLTPHYA